jgi:hypothetical protein
MKIMETETTQTHLRARASRTNPEIYWQGAAAGYRGYAATPPEGSPEQHLTWQAGYAFGRETHDCYKGNDA